MIKPNKGLAKMFKHSIKPWGTPLTILIKRDNFLSLNALKEVTMAKLTKEYFSNDEVLFVGYSKKNEAFSKTIYAALTKAGITVYPLSKNDKVTFDVQVYHQYNDLPHIPKCAYVLLNKQNTANVVQELKAQGVERVLFHSKKTVDPSTLQKCHSLGIQTAVACPMMLVGGGIHRLHAFFAGV